MSDETTPAETVWVQVPAAWVRTHGSHTCLVDDHNRTVGPVPEAAANGPCESDETTPGPEHPVMTRTQEVDAQTEQRLGQMHTAWWSARIRAATAQEVTVSAVRLMNEAGAERDQLKAEITQRAEAYAAAIEHTAGEAMSHRTCGMNLHAAIRRAEKAEAEIVRARTAAEPIRAGLADAEEVAGRPSDIGLSWYGHVDVADVRALVAALDQSRKPQS